MCKVGLSLPPPFLPPLPPSLTSSPTYCFGVGLLARAPFFTTLFVGLPLGSCDVALRPGDAALVPGDPALLAGEVAPRVGEEGFCVEDAAFRAGDVAGLREGELA